MWCCIPPQPSITLTRKIYNSQPSPIDKGPSSYARIHHIFRLLHTETRRTPEPKEPALRTPNVPALTELL